MKNTLMVPVVFLANTVLCAACIAFFSVLSSYSSILFISSGKWFPLFVIASWNAVSYAPFAALVGLLATLIYTMRRKTIPFVVIPVVLALVCASIVWFIPSSYAARDRLKGAEADVRRLEGLARGKAAAAGIILSSGDKDRIIWFPRSGGEGPLVAARSEAESGVPALSVYADVALLPDARSVSVGGGHDAYRIDENDPLFGVYSRMPWFIARGVRAVNGVMEAFRAAAERGNVDPYAVAGGFFLATLALFFVSRATGWRLLNLCFSLSVFSAYFALYRFTVRGPVFDFLLRYLPSSIPARLISPLMYATFAAFVFLVGVVFGIVRKARRAKYGLASGGFNE